MSRSIAKLAVWWLSLATANLVLADAYRTIPMNQKRLATYYVEANMHGSGDVEFMVDTGAGYTTINEFTLERLVRANNAEYVGEEASQLGGGRRQAGRAAAARFASGPYLWHMSAG